MKRGRLPKWGGHRAQAWTAAVLARYGTTCHLHLEGCTRLATTGDHIEPRSRRPDLQYVIDNGRPACLHCNQLRSTAPIAQLVVVDARNFFENPKMSRKESDQSPPRNLRKTSETRRYA